MSTVPFACPILALIVVVEPVLSDSSPIRLVMLILLIPPIPADSDRPLATDVLLRLLSNFILSAHISPPMRLFTVDDTTLLMSITEAPTAP